MNNLKKKTHGSHSTEAKCYPPGLTWPDMTISPHEAEITLALTWQ